MEEDFINNFVKTDEITDLWAFVKTVDWTERWLICLILFHILLTIVTLATRNYHTVQGFLFFGLLVTVKCSEIINEYAATHWRVFSKQQYFDSGGLFISVVFSMPVLFNCMMMVMNWLWQSSNIMAKVRRVEMEARLKSSKSLKDDGKRKKE